MLLPLLAAAVTTASFVSTVLSVHLLVILQGKGLALAAAVALGALVGPSQVGARAIELALSQRHHPIWTKLAASSLIVLGLAALLAGGPWLTPALVLYGAGIGLESIARGTLPLALVGPRRYPVVMGRIALPNLMVQAASPLVGSMLLGVVGADWDRDRARGRRRPQRPPLGRSRPRDRSTPASSRMTLRSSRRPPGGRPGRRRGEVSDTAVKPRRPVRQRGVTAFGCPDHLPGPVGSPLLARNDGHPPSHRRSAENGDPRRRPRRSGDASHLRRSRPRRPSSLRSRRRRS